MKFRKADRRQPASRKPEPPKGKARLAARFRELGEHRDRAEQRLSKLEADLRAEIKRLRSEEQEYAEFERKADPHSPERRGHGYARGAAREQADRLEAILSVPEQGWAQPEDIPSGGVPAAHEWPVRVLDGVEIRQSDHFTAVLDPQGDDVKPGAKALAGRRLEFEAGWVIQPDDEVGYLGQFACVIQPRSPEETPTDFVWVPDSDLKEVKALSDIPDSNTEDPAA